jgi:anti-anti-sigma factor
MSTPLSPVTTPTQLQLDTSWPAPSTARVAVVGEVDLASSHVLRDRLLGMLREHAPAVLDVDLAGVPLLDCAGISALVVVRNAAAHTGCQVRLTRPQPIVGWVLGVSGLLGRLTAPIDQPPATGPAIPAQKAIAPVAATRPSGLMAA